ncbi:heme ABC transporter ATP-binding protein [Candidatus Omnitrophus magneticus]|uniref:Probable ATP-binding protein YbiT n=1 Tax=Candidatus Omnitrophus magneticus TaxID=1609969 RepID=A0A0F0CQS5_9BACT|nr:heme ABC transporter ATP-binding protein [Candidatus Omnitrophus magneticus]
MISANGLSLQFGKRILFSDVNITFTEGNCYGLIGANGSGKSTFLKILSGEIEPTTGQISVAHKKRISVLKQDQFAFDEYTVLETVIMGHKKLHSVMKEKEILYAKEDFSHEDGIHSSKLEEEFSEMGGWNADSDAAKLLSNLDIPQNLIDVKMSQIESGQKVRVLLAQALFGNPDILLLDEPTNHLDIDTRMWLEEFLCEFKNTAIVVSHDRHFMDKVCTYIADIDYGKIQLYPGNFTFWQESSQLALKQRTEHNKKVEDRRKELLEFIARFSANASKSKQATSRKKSLEKLTLEDIKPSSRKYPYINFEQSAPAGNNILSIENLSKSIDGKVMFKDLTVTVRKGDKIAFVGHEDIPRTTLFKILMGEMTADSGTFKWGASTSQSYFPKDNSNYFTDDILLIDWISQYSANTTENFVRGFLGRVLFSGEESLKSVKVLSGGERVRCMLARMMLTQANVLILDEPTNHLDLESITALNKGLSSFPGTILFSSYDHQLVQTAANRIIEITPKGYMDRIDTKLDEYLENPDIQVKRKELYS